MVKNKLIFLILIGIFLADGKESLVSEIDKNVLKDLLNQNIDYLNKVIRLVAEICKDGN